MQGARRSPALQATSQGDSSAHSGPVSASTAITPTNASRPSLMRVESSQSQSQPQPQSPPPHPHPQRLTSSVSSASSASAPLPRAATSKLQKKSLLQDPPAPKEPKKKRRFFGFGASSDSSSKHAASAAKEHDQSSTSSSSGLFTSKRSLSTRTRPVSYQGLASDKENSTSSADPQRPDPIAEEAASTRSTSAYRHSIAISPSPTPANDSAHADEHDQANEPIPGPVAPQQDLPSPVSSIAAPFAAFNTSTSEGPADEVGSKPSSAWSDRNRGLPALNHYPQFNTSQFLNLGDSRPSSRHSLEPSPPLQAPPQSQHLAYHPRGEVSQSSISRVDISRDPSPLHQPSDRQPLSQASSAGGGNYLDVASGRKPQQKAIPMVHNNGTADRGATPPPNKSKEDLASLDFPQLLAKHEELNDKYRKVKKYYFEKDAQVQQLQNQLAHQRLAQSRTSLDDNEYSTRFQRLDGAINNLAFNVRKDWKAVPPWLSPFVNSDATQKVTKEMTAVGRACISRWLVDEIFDRVFHPALEPLLSGNLKIVERNLRRYAPPVNTDEERDALLAKISNWRLATLDGLSEALNSPSATEYRNELTRSLVETLTSDLQMNLTSPPPAGLEAGVIGIIELAVGIAANLPLESRDVYVEYILPGIPLNDAYMKVEGTLPPLTNPGETYVTEQDQQQQQRQAGADEPMGGEDGQGGASGPIIGGFLGAGPRDKKVNGAGVKKGEPDDRDRKEIDKVRFAGFMSVMVKGKSMLIKAPVFV